MSIRGVGGRAGCVGAVFAAAGLAGTAGAESVEYTFGAQGAGGQSASAVFRFDSSARTLTVRIENTTAGAHNGAQHRALSALFWNMTPESLPITGVISSSGGSVNNPDGVSPAQMWGYRDNLGAGFTPHGAQFGLSAVGFGVFGHAHLLAPGGPAPRPGDIGGSLLSETGYTDRAEHLMYRSYVEFIFGLDRQFFANGVQGIAVGDVTWQFGSSFADPSVQFAAAPLSPAVSVGFAGLAALAGYRHLRRRALGRAF